MKDYYIILLSVGFATLLLAYLPTWCKKIKVSFTIPLLLVGIAMYFLKVPLPWPNPVWPIEWTTRFSELIVIISLMSAGLKIGLRYSWTRWRKAFSLVGITMPLSIVAVYFIAHYLLEFQSSVSLLLGAILAPTDPVLASELQLQDEKSDDTGLRFTLTSEAGINDGLAFPFVFLAIMLSNSNNFSFEDAMHWASFYVFYKIAVGFTVGALIGYFYSLSIHQFNQVNQSKILNGFIGVSLTLFSYGLTEIISGYGFLAVFFTGLFAQYHAHTSKKSMPETEMLLFVEETEKFFLLLWILFFGGSLASGILEFANWKGVAFSLILVVVLRPIFGYLAMFFTPISSAKKWAVSFFGIRGIGSVFYLGYALGHGNFGNPNALYSITSYVILFSIIIHGFSSQRVVEYFKKRSK